MADITLVVGYCAIELSQYLNMPRTHHVRVLSLYVEFVQKHYPPVVDLNSRIIEHYEGWSTKVGDIQIDFSPGFRHDKCKCDHWQRHLLHQIEAAADEHPMVVVEGYPLADYRDYLDRQLTAKGHRVRHTHVKHPASIFPV